MPTVEDIPTMDEAALEGPPAGALRPPAVSPPTKDHEEDDEDDEVGFTDASLVNRHVDSGVTVTPMKLNSLKVAYKPHPHLGGIV